MTLDIQQHAEDNIIKRIRQKNGVLQNGPYKLSDEISIVRAIMSPSSVDEIAEDPRVYRVEKTMFFNCF